MSNCEICKQLQSFYWKHLLCSFHTDPRLTDYGTLLRNVQDLKEGKPIEVPIYDFKTSSRVGYRSVILVRWHDIMAKAKCLKLSHSFWYIGFYYFMVWDCPYSQWKKRCETHTSACPCQDNWSSKFPNHYYWGDLCIERKLETFIGSSCICHWWSALWPGETGLEGYTASWSRTWRDNPPNIWNGLSSPC